MAPAARLPLAMRIPLSVGSCPRRERTGLAAQVWNFRKTETAGLAVFGSGQCHLDGLAFLGAHLKALGYTRVLWFNMREEPVVFLNGQACAPRSANNMNENVVRSNSHSPPLEC